MSGGSSRVGIYALWSAIRKKSVSSCSNEPVMDQYIYISNQENIPTRSEVLAKLRSEGELDVLVIGAGATGAGVALDGALRGMKIACIDKGDFSSETSSRSTKLIWGGSRYLVLAFVSLLNGDMRLLKHPVSTIKKFIADFKMVLNCHRERKFLLLEQPHLTNWIPIAVPLSKWLLWPPPFDFAPAAIGPLGLFPAFFKFYDMLSGFSCPPSTFLTPSEIKTRFPQLDSDRLKYCSVFYEGQHNDARTNLAIALTAAKHGALISNYCEAVDVIRMGKKIVGVIARDALSGEEFEIRAKSIVYCGGPFTDVLRSLGNPEATPMVVGARGSHIVVPAKFAPSDLGMVDMNTSDGRFLFFLPWEGYVLIGTTDIETEAEKTPVPSDKEISWLINEANKYLREDCHIQRDDVLSAWAGTRPLVVDHSTTVKNTSGVSRDHSILYDSDSKVITVAGGKWTTYREMAHDTIDAVLAHNPDIGHFRGRMCSTLETKLIGFKGYSSNLKTNLSHDFEINEDLSRYLVSQYGGRAVDVLMFAQHTNRGMEGVVDGFPMIRAEVLYSIRREWAIHATDIICRRSYLAFVDKALAMKALPVVIDLMAQELGWTPTQIQQETAYCENYLEQFRI